MPFITLPLEELVYRTLPRVDPGRALSNWEWKVLTAIAEALHEGSPVAISKEQIADNVETFLICGNSRRAFRVRALLATLELLPVVSTGSRLSQMGVSERRAFLYHKFEHGHRVYRLCAKVRYLVFMGVYGDEAAKGATQFVDVPNRPRFQRKRAALSVVRTPPSVSAYA
ncbi:MAG: hypothetical protein SFV15_08640 [Polyangiaceae bacterium]|nr:hypothetical protein [Polyangiaceae bacterium]